MSFDKIFYKAYVKLETPLTIGSGDNLISDIDVLKDSNNRPYIPATSIAGVLSHAIDDKETRIQLFSNSDEDSKDMDMSHVIVYDGLLLDNLIMK